MLTALKQHWPEYAIEAAGLGFFMLSACAFGALLEHPGSPLRQAIGDPFARRVLMGLAMGLTAITIIYSPWGQRSGAHINPAVTLVFLRLGKIERRDALGYVVFQFIGAIVGTWLAALWLGGALEHRAVNYVTTMPGAAGAGAAFIAEVFITFILMTAVLQVSNRLRWARYTGLLAGALVAGYISFEAPLSGMSMNPARTFGSAFVAQSWRALWIYFTAPPLGMLLAAEVYLRRQGARGVLCAKLHHHNNERCIFKCNFDRCGAPATSGAVATPSSINH
jgi:aquaporin Z